MSILHRNGHSASRVRMAGRKLVDTVKRKQDAPTEIPYRVLSPPLVTLFVSPSDPQQSEEAFQVLAAGHTAFGVAESPDGKVSARFAGKTQYGIEGVRNLHEGLLEFERILLDARGDETFAADLERRYDPALGERARAELAEYMDAARAELDRLLYEPEDAIATRV